MHLLVEVRQVVLVGPGTHLRGGPFAVTLVVPVTVPVVPPPLVVALQLVVEHDAPHAPAPGLNGACGVLVGAVDMDIVLELARALDARVEGLGALVPGRPVRLQEPSACGGQPDRMVAGARDARGLDQPLLAQVAQVARAWVRGRAAGVDEITTGDDPERADGGERARLRAPQRVPRPRASCTTSRSSPRGRSTWRSNTSREGPSR